MRSCAAAPTGADPDDWMVAEAIVGCSAVLRAKAIVAASTPA
jgi:hypothetical protein